MKTTALIQITREDFDELLNRSRAPRLVDRKEAARLISVKESTIDTLVQSGTLEPYYDKRENVERHMIRFLESDVIGCFTKIRKL